jgi:hypothetical protein
VAGASPARRPVVAKRAAVARRVPKGRDRVIRHLRARYRFLAVGVTGGARACVHRFRPAGASTRSNVIVLRRPVPSRVSAMRLALARRNRRSTGNVHLPLPLPWLHRRDPFPSRATRWIPRARGSFESAMRLALARRNRRSRGRAHPPLLLPRLHRRDAFRPSASTGPPSRAGSSQASCRASGGPIARPFVFRTASTRSKQRSRKGLRSAGNGPAVKGIVLFLPGLRTARPTRSPFVPGRLPRGPVLVNGWIHGARPGPRAPHFGGSSRRVARDPSHPPPPR